MTKIINIEDVMIKHCEINRALQYNGYPGAEHAKNAEEGLRMIEDALAEGKPYELLITDMEFPVNGVVNPKREYLLWKNWSVRRFRFRL